MAYFLLRCAMSSKKDQAIKENLLKESAINAFHSNIYIRKSNDAILANSIEDFMKQITDPCHIWRGYKTDRGYGYFTVYSKELKRKISIKAHRFSYALHYGFDALPAGVEGGKRNIINHICCNTSCVNPIHLEAITQTENMSPEKRKPKNV